MTRDRRLWLWLGLTATIATGVFLAVLLTRDATDRNELLMDVA